MESFKLNEILGYIRLASKVLFDDPKALTLRQEFRRGGGSLGSDGNLRPNEDGMFVEIDELIEVVVDKPEEDITRKLFLARSPNVRYTGELSGSWFEDGRAIVKWEEALDLEEAGCSIEVIGV